MKKSVFNAKRERLVNLLQMSAEIAKDLLEVEKGRYKNSNERILALLKEHSADNDEELDKSEFVRYEAMLNKGNLDCTLHAINFEIERMKSVIMK